VTAALQTPLVSFTARVGCAGFTPGQEAQPSAQIVDNIESLLRGAEASLRVPPSSTAESSRIEAG
jgi:hypothetical protein